MVSDVETRIGCPSSRGLKKMTARFELRYWRLLGLRLTALSAVMFCAEGCHHLRGCIEDGGFVHCEAHFRYRITRPRVSRHVLVGAIDLVVLLSHVTPIQRHLCAFMTALFH
jgi:hypothetical protein